MTITEQQSIKSARSSRFAMLTGALAVIGCALACSLPLLAAGGALAGAGALMAGWWPAAILALGAAAASAFYFVRRRTARAGQNAGGCGCKGDC